MAVEYEIKEVGFIGSLWQGEYTPPINVGKTIEITNVLNTIESGRRQSIFVSTKENVDISAFNRQLPDGNFYFKAGKLSNKDVDDLSVLLKIDKDFLRTQDVLFRYNRRTPVIGTNASSIPIQENWSFDISDVSNPVYVYNLPEFILYANFVILVDEQYQQTLSDYFSGLQQDGFVQATPPSRITPTVSINTPQITTVMPPPPVFEGPKFRPPIIDDAEIERLAIERFDSILQLNQTELPENERNPFFNINTTDDFNRALKELDKRISFINDMLNQSGTIQDSPFSAPIGMRVELVFLGMIRNYLFERLRVINDVGSPTQEPERYSVDDEGNIQIEPKVEVLPETVETATSALQDVLDFDDLIDEIIEDLEVDDNNTYVFKKISKVSDYDLPTLRYKTRGLFKCTGEKLSTFYTGSLTEKQQKYYTSVFNERYNTDESYHQFDISYCHISGAGSSHIENETELYPAKTMYRKYMMECFGTTEGKFRFKNGRNGDYFYTIQLDRDQFSEKLDAGNFELALCELSQSGTSVSQISTKLFTLIDESRDTKQEIVTNEDIQEYYYVTSGSLRDGVYNESGDDAWGIVFPRLGLIVLDGVVLDQSCSFNTVTGSNDGGNTKRLFLSISGAAVPTQYRPSSSFFARSFETFLTETYFCRADYDEFNTSTNYTYVTGSNGVFKYDYFKKRPHAYITTIGLYNRNKELLAIGKLRNPILKSEGKVCIFEVVVRLN